MGIDRESGAVENKFKEARCNSDRDVGILLRGGGYANQYQRVAGAITGHIST